MDFPDLAEYIGPLIFGLVAWLSNYFSKKKKPKEINKDIKEKKNEGFGSEINNLYDKIVSNEKEEDVMIANKIINKSKIKDEKNKIIDLPTEKIKKIKDTKKIQSESVNVQEQASNKSINKTKYSQRIPVNSKTIKDKIKSKGGLREAFILKEILERKYD